MVKWLYALGVLVLAACARETPATAIPSSSLAQVWRLGGLANPESVALSGDGAFLYVSNVDGEGEAKDGNGFISRVSTAGRMLEREWARGLDAPKGMALEGEALYVADIDRIVVIDAASGAIRQRLPAPGAQFLNDVAIAPAGYVLIADSGAQRIYALQDGAVSVWLESDLLRSVNGLLTEPNRLVVTTMAGKLLAIDYQSREITELADGLGEADGVAPLGAGRYLVSEWPGLLHIVNPDGSHATISDTRAENRYFNDFLLVGDTLYQPHWRPSELTAYRLDR